MRDRGIGVRGGARIGIRDRNSAEWFAADNPEFFIRSLYENSKRSETCLEPEQTETDGHTDVRASFIEPECRSCPNAFCKVPVSYLRLRRELRTVTDIAFCQTQVDTIERRLFR